MEIRQADLTTITWIWTERWGLPVITSRGSYQPDQVSGLMARGANGCHGLVTWATYAQEAEIVTIDAIRPGGGVGTALLSAAEKVLAGAGTRQITIETTNDNLAALGFYIRRGYRLVGVRLDAMAAVRRAKPMVPEIGLDGIPLRDLLLLEKSPGNSAG